MMNILLIALLSVFIYMLSFYLFAQIIKDNSIVDIGWGMGFVVLTSVLLLYTEKFSWHHLLLFFIILSWGARLSIHILIRNLGKPEDFRYANWRKSWGKKAPIMAFFKVFMLQGLVMLVVSLPIIFAFSSNHSEPSALNITGYIVFGFGFIFEAIADYQLSAFKKNKENKGKIITHGLWSISRHPNYFGEALLWWGIYLSSVGSGYEYISIISPILMSLLLRFGSGVPMLEEKYRQKPEFKEYAKNTAVFIPFIGRKGL
jgi:steroid 5-alpha reductase family enzyme